MTILTPSSQTFRLTTSLWVPCNRKHVFEIFSDAFQLQYLTPHWLNFRVLTPAPIRMQKGQLIDYRIRLHGIPIRWRTEITNWEPPFYFTDSQLRGPYSLWVHTHTFEEINGGTLVHDQVNYRVPGGAIANGLFVQGKLRQIFNFRHDRLPELLGLPAILCDRSQVLFSAEEAAPAPQIEPDD